MTNEQMHARHLVELGFLQDVVGELELSSRIIERSPQVAYHTLLVEIEADSKRRSRQLAMNFYPLEDEEFSDTLFLQYFIGLPFEVKQSALPTVAQILPDVNNKVVLGHFGLTAGARQLHFRYVQPLPSDEVMSAEKVASVLLLVRYTPILFGDLLEEVASGAVTLDAARARVESTYMEVSD